MSPKNGKSTSWSDQDLPDLQHARALWEDSPVKALELFKKTARRNPRNLNALLDAARALGTAHHIGDADKLLSRAATILKTTPEGLEKLGQSYRMAQMPDKAATYFRQAIQNPDQLESVIELTVYHERRHQVEKAREVLQPALNRHPSAPPLRLLNARLNKRASSPDEALTEFISVATDESAHPYHRAEAYYEIANLQDLQTDYKSAFNSASKAKKLLTPLSTGLKDATQLWDRRHQQMTQALTPELIQTWQTQSPPSPIAPCLLTGCPRSGTTLFEQIIGNHPNLQSFDELDIYPRFIFGSMLKDTPPDATGEQALTSITDKSAKTHASQYWNLFANHQSPSTLTRTLLDKNPSATGQIPAYLRLHPHAKILYALRDPRDIAISCFMRFLPMNSVSANFLTPSDTVKWIKQELALWTSLRTRIDPSQWHEVHYEKTIHDMRSSLSGALDLLGLQWDKSLENYLESTTSRPANSPTYLEVTQPIHTKSIERYKNYAFAFDREFETLQPIIEQLF